MPGVRQQSAGSARGLKAVTAARKGEPCLGSGQGYRQDAPSGGYAVLGFFFPVVGLVLYLVWKENLPLRARSAGKGALIGAIVYVALVILSVVLQVMLYMSMLR